MRILSIIFMAVLLIGCKSSKISRVDYAYKADSTVVSRVRIDTLRVTEVRQDSVIVRDSVFVERRSDTVYIYKERNTTRLLYDFSNTHRAVEVHDTIYIAKADSVAHEEVKEAVKKPPLSERVRTLICLAIAIGGGLLGFKAWIGYIKAEGMK